MSSFRVLAKSLIPAVGAALLLAVLPGAAHALGLGEARVDSYLNQPLDIRIRLLDASELELDSLSVGPATPDDYQRLGIGSAALALDLELSIDRSQSPAIVRIRSSRPVTDPIVQLLVDARWSSGRMLREYTLFLDPPTVDVAPPVSRPAARPAAEPAPAQRPAERPAQRPARPASRPAQEPPRVRARDGGERLVQSGDTLWSIAQANLPASDISMSQMMLAIVDLNPEAFRNGNVHQLLRGSRLTLPSAEQVRAIDRAAAEATVRAQNRAFNQRLGAGDVPVISDAARGSDADRPDAPEAPAPRPTASTPSTVREPEPEGRLELVPAGDDASGSGLDEDGDEVNRLRQQLARTEEELYTARLEAEEFRSRLGDLESLVAQNPTGVGIGDAELAGLEATLRAARLAAAEDADPTLRAEVTAQLDDYLARFESAADASGDTMAATDAPGGEPEVETPAEAEPEPAAQPAEPVVTQVGSQQRGWMSSPLFWPLAGLAALLIALGGVWIALQRRRREAEEPPAVRGSVSRPGPKPASRPAAPTADPVERARAAVDASPNDLAAHLVLLEALAGRRDQERFESALEDMFEHVETGEEPAWREAVELASGVVPEHVLVKGSADWMAGSDALREEPRDELDEESEVGDLMSRLESESADEVEPDDSDWMTDGTASEADEADSPLLREASGEDEPLVLGGLDEEESVPTEDDAVELSSGAGEADEDEALQGWLGEDLSDDRSADADDGQTTKPEPAPERESEPEPEPSAPSAEPVEDDGLLMDWTEDAESSDASASEATGQADEGDASDASAEDGDIFAPSDDDVDVKLDLARAYLSWNSTDSAKTLLEEVVREGNAEQKAQAKKLLDGL